MNNDWNSNTGKDINTIMLVSEKSDRYMVGHIKRIIKLLVEKRNSEAELQKEINTILNECMRDYYGELK